MRNRLLSTIFALPICLTLPQQSMAAFPPVHSVPDSGIVGHQTDGLVSEWPADRFTLDKASGIQYALDNDADFLYVALNIAEQGEQMKIMRMGMNFFIDLKGKHKEGRGIEFPVKREGGPLQATDNRDDQQPRNRDGQGGERPDFKKIRAMMSLNLYSMKLFGFADGEPKEQGLDLHDNIQIAYKWDSADIMHIEYLIPLKMLTDEVSTLDHKEISAGWLVNGMETPSGDGGLGSGGGFGGGGGRGGRGGGGGGFRSGSPGINRNSDQFQQRMKEQKFWSKYTITLTTASKAF